MISMIQLLKSEWYFELVGPGVGVRRFRCHRVCEEEMTFSKNTKRRVPDIRNIRNIRCIQFSLRINKRDGEIQTLQK